MIVKKILIQHFPSLDNYGTAMMGLVMSQFLSDHFGGNVEIYSDLQSEEMIPEILDELRGSVPIKRYVHPYSHRLQRSRGIVKKFWQIYSMYVYREFDLIVVLGGDDLSEYYSRRGVLIESIQLVSQRFFCPIVLVGQTIGPFNLLSNRLLLRRLLRYVPIATRDQWCYNYLQEDLKLKKNLFQGADLAFCDLPLQNNDSIRQEILHRYHLVPDQYVTVIVSGLVKSYCKNRQVYLQNWHEMICRMAKNPFLQNKKICLLAHTFAKYGDEGEIITELFQTLPEDIRQRVVPVKERILPTRARFLLGNGYLTITGRMHASISTFQMGKPAIVLSYSKKYEGIIGMNLNRPDLIVEAGMNDALWESMEIVEMIDEKVCYLCENYDRITDEIRERVAVQKQLAESMLQKCIGVAK